MSDAFTRAVERDAEQRRQRRRARARRVFRIHAGVFAVVNLVFVVEWALHVVFDGGTWPWFLYPLLGWGAGLLLHYALVRRAFQDRERPSER